MKRAEKEYRARVSAQQAREAAENQANAAEHLAIKALLDQRIPDSERLVCDMKHPLVINELRAHGSGPTGVTYTTDVVQRYARIIATHTGGDAQAVKQHFEQLIRREQAAKLGIDIAKLRISDRATPGGDGTIVDILLSDHDVVAIAEYIVSPDYLNLGNLPPNPFGNPRVASLLASINWLRTMAQYAPAHPYTGTGKPTTHQLKHQMELEVEVVVNEISRAMPGNAARAAALKAMRLDDCLKIYTPGVVRRTGWQDIQVYETDHVTGQPTPATSRIPVYGIVPGTASDPTRYRVVDRAGAAGRLWFLYST
jgi:hypothetical protein